MIFQGKTVEEAIELGLKEMGLTRENAVIRELEQGKKGIFGIGAVPAKVEIEEAVKLTDGQRAVQFLEGLFPLLGSEVTPVLTEEDEKIVIMLEGEKRDIVGRRGELIDALQTLAGAVANTGRKTYRRIVVDWNSYREEREESLRKLAQKLAAKAVRTGKRVRLESMNPYERRIIHSALADSQEVTTKSEGKEPYRYVVITPNNLKSDKWDRDRGERGRGRGKYEGRGKDRGRDKKYGEKKPYPKRELPSEATPESSGTSFGSKTAPGYRKGGFSGFFGTYLGKEESEAEKPVEAPSEAPVTENDAPMSETEE